MAVLVLAGLVLAITPPLISAAVPGVQLKGTARTLVSALRQTRNLAIGEARPQRLTLDLEARTIQVPGRSRPIAIPERVQVRMTVAASQRSGPEQAALAFFPDGSSTGGRIELARGDRSFSVDVDWLTGKVTLLE